MEKFNENFVKKLKVPEGKKEILVIDASQPGFGIRKLENGHASYFVRYTIAGQHRKLTLGRVLPKNLKAMRLEASKILSQVNAGIDVVADRKSAAQARQEAKQVKTLGELVPEYLKVREFGDKFWRKVRPKTVREITRYLEKAWLPLHDKPVDQITRKMVKDRRDKLADGGSMAANQALAALSTFYAWAIDRGHISETIIDGERVKGFNPTDDIKQLPFNKRTRVLSEAELVDIWQACGDDDFGRIVKLLMLTGQRRQEIGSLEWAEISVEKRQILLPEEKVKNKQAHIVPLSDAALALLPGIPTDMGIPISRYVFGPFQSWDLNKKRLDKRIAERRGSPLRPWVLHDLRRSVVTYIATLDYAQPHVIEAIVNHVSGHKAGVAGTYNLATYLPERREALERWSRYLTGLVTFPLSPAKRSEPEIVERNEVE